MFNPSAVASSCSTYGGGKYSFEMALTYTDCPAGKASSAEGTFSCAVCTAGKRARSLKSMNVANTSQRNVAAANFSHCF